MLDGVGDIYISIGARLRFFEVPLSDGRISGAMMCWLSGARGGRGDGVSFESAKVADLDVSYIIADVLEVFMRLWVGVMNLWVRFCLIDIFVRNNKYRSLQHFLLP